MSLDTSPDFGRGGTEGGEGELERVSPPGPGPTLNTTKKSFAPRFHAGSRKSRIRMYRSYGEFLGAYREAADLLKKGKRNVSFPEGCFPPGLPYVGPTGVPPDT